MTPWKTTFLYEQVVFRMLVPGSVVMIVFGTNFTSEPPQGLRILHWKCVGLGPLHDFKFAGGCSASCDKETPNIADLIVTRPITKKEPRDNYRKTH